VPPENWPPRTIEVLALRILDLASGAAMADWAISALEASFDTPALRKLAAFDVARATSLSETSPVFDTALEELAVPNFDRKTALLRYLEVLVQELAHSTVDVDEMLGLIHVRIVSPLNHCDEVRPWCLLSERLHPLTHEDMDEQAIRAFARRWLEDRPGSSCTPSGVDHRRD
jgi:hypothetical protein